MKEFEDFISSVFSVVIVLPVCAMIAIFLAVPFGVAGPGLIPWAIGGMLATVAVNRKKLIDGSWGKRGGIACGTFLSVISTWSILS